MKNGRNHVEAGDIWMNQEHSRPPDWWEPTNWIRFSTMEAKSRIWIICLTFITTTPRSRKMFALVLFRSMVITNTGATRRNWISTRNNTCKLIVNLSSKLMDSIIASFWCLLTASSNGRRSLRFWSQAPNHRNVQSVFIHRRQRKWPDAVTFFATHACCTIYHCPTRLGASAQSAMKAFISSTLKAPRQSTITVRTKLAKSLRWTWWPAKKDPCLLTKQAMFAAAIAFRTFQMARKI